MRRAMREPGRRVCLAVVVALVATALPCPGRDAACRDGACDPHCPVRPGRYGYYPTQWRRWPDDQRAADAEPAAATPVSPPRSVVPGVDEESPRRPGATMPLAPQSLNGTREPSGTAARIDRLVAEADAARLGGPMAREDFTLRLVSAMLTEHDPQARRTVLSLAAAFDTQAAEAICVGALEDPDPQVRLEACRLCGERRGPDAAERLARRARLDDDLGVRLRAVRTLGELGDPAAVPHLVALLDDPDPAVQARAMAALARATGQRLGTDVERWRSWAAHPRPVGPRWSWRNPFADLF